MQNKRDTVQVTDNAAAHRFETRVGGQLAIAEYQRDGDTIVFTHTEVPREIGGRGVASALAHAALEQAKNEGLRVVPQCAFFAVYIRRHPEYAPLVDAH